MRNAIETSPLFVVGMQDVPGCVLAVRRFEHLVAGFGIVVPAGTGREVHGTELPLPHRIVDTSQEPPFLLRVTHLKPVLNQDDATTDDVLLDFRAQLEKPTMLFVGAETHHTLDTGPVVPAAIENHDL